MAERLRGDTSMFCCFMYFTDLYCIPSVSIAIACLWAAEIGSDDLEEIQANQP